MSAEHKADQENSTCDVKTSSELPIRSRASSDSSTSSKKRSLLKVFKLSSKSTDISRSKSMHEVKTIQPPRSLRDALKGYNEQRVEHKANTAPSVTSSVRASLPVTMAVTYDDNVLDTSPERQVNPGCAHREMTASDNGRDISLSTKKSGLERDHDESPSISNSTSILRRTKSLDAKQYSIQPPSSGYQPAISKKVGYRRKHASPEGRDDKTRVHSFGYGASTHRRTTSASTKQSGILRTSYIATPTQRLTLYNKSGDSRTGNERRVVDVTKPDSSPKDVEQEFSVSASVSSEQTAKMVPNTGQRTKSSKNDTLGVDLVIKPSMTSLPTSTRRNYDSDRSEIRQDIAQRPISIQLTPQRVQISKPPLASNIKPKSILKTPKNKRESEALALTSSDTSLSSNAMTASATSEESTDGASTDVLPLISDEQMRPSVEQLQKPQNEKVSNVDVIPRIPQPLQTYMSTSKSRPHAKQQLSSTVGLILFEFPRFRVNVIAKSATY